MRSRLLFVSVTVLFITALAMYVHAQVPRQDRRSDEAALRSAVMGPSGGVSTGHPLTTAAAFGMLLRGGNAFDAGLASLLVGGVLEQDLYSLGGEALVLVYPQNERKVTSIVGQGWAPPGRGASRPQAPCAEREKDDEGQIADGGERLHPAVVTIAQGFRH